MDAPTTINGFAEEYDLRVGDVMLLVLKYLVDDPTLIDPSLRRVLSTATDDEIEEALETIADDLRATKNKDTMQ